MKERTNTEPAPAAKPAANEDVGCGAATATTAPTASRPKSRGRDTTIGGTAGIIELRRGYYDCLMHKEKAMKKVRVLGSAVLAGAALVWIAGCASSGDKAPQAMARIISASGTKVQGNALFTQLPAGGVKTEVWIENATPGTHGLHIHEKGDCSAPDATSAGGHFNAAGNPHAAPADQARHNGDLGNIEVGADGKGHLEITSNLLTVSPGPDSVVGRSVIFHEKADDLKTQPTGNAGGRVACGVIGIAKGE